MACLQAVRRELDGLKHSPQVGGLARDAVRLVERLQAEGGQGADGLVRLQNDHEVRGSRCCGKTGGARREWEDWVV